MSKVLVLTYWSYKEGLIQNYTLPYLDLMHKALPQKSEIYLFCQEKAQLQMTAEEEKETKEKLRTKNIHLITIPYRPFGLMAIIQAILTLLKLWSLCLYKPIHYIHAWCTPAGALGYGLSILSGKPLIIDSFEPHAESMVENGTWSHDSLAYKVLFWFEKKQVLRAKYIIGLTEKTPEYIQKTYHHSVKSHFVKPACVQLSQFEISHAQGLPIVCIYAGKFGGIYLDQEVFDFFAVAYQHWQGQFKAILLSDLNPDQANIFAKKAHLPLHAFELKYVAPHEVPSYMKKAHFAINPVKPVPSKRYCTSIKDGEYWASGLPVVIPPNISDDSNIILEEGIGVVLKSFSKTDYEIACTQMHQLLHQEQLPQFKKKIRNIAVKYRNFEKASLIYQKIYGS